MDFLSPDYICSPFCSSFKFKHNFYMIICWLGSKHKYWIFIFFKLFSWGTPCQSVSVTNYIEGSTKVKENFKIHKFERNVQVRFIFELLSLQCPFSKICYWLLHSLNFRFSFNWPFYVSLIHNVQFQWRQDGYLFIIDEYKITNKFQ